MKILKIAAITLIASLFLAGCGEKNKEYFLKNIDAANKKVDECNSDLEKAFMARDEKAVEKLDKNTECKAAFAAIKEDKKLKYELEQKRKEAERKKAIESEMATIKAQINGLSWSESVNEYLKEKDCVNSYSFSKSPKCEAWETVYDEQVDKGKKELKQLSFDDIKLKMQSLCQLDKRSGSNCAVAQKALEEKASEDLANDNIETIASKKPIYCATDIDNLSACRTSWYTAWENKGNEFVKLYTENDAEFIATYNSCVDKLDELSAQKLSWDEKNKLKRAITEGYPCSQAKKAYSERGMGYSSFNNKIEK